jgi:hypothetical protein
MVLKYSQRNARQALMLAGIGYSAGSSSVPDENVRTGWVFSMSIDYREEINALVMRKALAWISNRNRSLDEFIRTGRNLQRDVV